MLRQPYACGQKEALACPDAYEKTRENWVNLDDTDLLYSFIII